MKLTPIIAASIGVFGVVAAPAFAADPLSPGERIWYAQGLTHPMVVHIPIALLLAGAIAAVLRVVFRRIPISIVYYCLAIGALGAVPSVLAGWAWAPQKDSGFIDPFDTKSDIFWHRWGGIAVTAISLAVLVWATVQLRRKHRYELKVATESAAAMRAAETGKGLTVTATQAPGQLGWQFAVVLLAGAMGWVAHDGGELAYPNNLKNIIALATGEQLPKHIAKEREKEKKTPSVPVAAPPTRPAIPAIPGTQEAVTIPSATAPASKPATVPMATTGGKIDFAKEVWPIFIDKCIYCHGEEKNKGKLRMHTEDLALVGGSDGPLYIKGNSEESLLIKHILTDDEDEVMPPPKEDKPVTAEELRILRAWVNEGAVWAPVPPAK
ncbi:c-type cytochrome domain-containing protein [Humisphaera borealis]|uniref:Cytochrome C Planctomycete-type domain-containing protein n=1 Tax=Humisphaera borealis TaxID=2807512 RepID=A0A7M2X181_9BACT|nr:c-type cytochrome domain-containing protein [Humisphaera borealis]QOV90871.1 hypothetical protein IPV69_05790 [Humisphaera borealis]